MQSDDTVISFNVHNGQATKQRPLKRANDALIGPFSPPKWAAAFSGRCLVARCFSAGRWWDSEMVAVTRVNYQCSSVAATSLSLCYIGARSYGLAAWNTRT